MNEFNKSSLTDGMNVILRNNDQGIIHKGQIHTKDFAIQIENAYNDNLIIKDDEAREYDIMDVYKIDYTRKSVEWLFSRKRPFTKDELRSGMWVKFKNICGLFIVIKTEDGIDFTSITDWIPGDKYDNNMLPKDGFPELEKVYDTYVEDLQLEEDDLAPIWENK